MTASDIHFNNEPSACEKTAINKMENTSKTEFPVTKYIGTDYSYKHEIVWKNAIGFLILHLLGIWGILVMLSGNIYMSTFIWGKYIA